MNPDLLRARRAHLADILPRSAQRYRNKIALVDGAEQISFLQLEHLVQQLAGYFYQQGLRTGDCVMLMSHNCWQFVVILHAAARLGLIAAPINFMLNSSEVAYLLQHAQPKLLIAEDQLCTTLDQACCNLPAAPALRLGLSLNAQTLPPAWQDLASCWQQTAQPLPEMVLDPRAPIRMMYTSGTESLPKGVLLSSDSLMLQYQSCIVEGEMTSSDREIHAFPFYHCAQLDAFLHADLMLGATSYIFRSFDAERILHCIDSAKINKLFCPPTAWIALINSPRWPSSDLRSLNKAYYGASAMPRSVIERLTQLLPALRFWQFYGQTEMAPLATVLHPEEHHSHIESVGKPALHVETQIMDPEGHLLPSGSIGEIVHRSGHLCLGYAHDLEKTLHSFRHGWFHSGDLGYIDAQGYLYVVDRMKDMVKSGGENISSREVEAVLYQLAGVQEVAVFGVADAQWIEAVTAVVILHADVVLDAQQVLAHCRQHLAAYKVPKRVYFAEQLPKNASGKILKRELKQQYQPSCLT
jgi:fatty-acyl-CoA synthase